MTRTVFCFGNPYIEMDSLALILADELKSDEFNFQKCYSPDFLADFDDDELLILDVAKGIDKVEVLDDAGYLDSGSIVSLHDFDLGFFLKLLDEIGKLKKLRIIAIPLEYDKNDAIKEVLKKLEGI